jgi:hypothetical protein
MGGALDALTCLAAGAAAALAAPALAAFLDRDRGDNERGCRVEPPETEERVPEQPNKNGGGEVGAEQILGPLAAGCDRAELVGKPPLRDAEERHPDHARRDKRDPEPTRLGLLARDQLVNSLEGDVWGE